MDQLQQVAPAMVLGGLAVLAVIGWQSFLKRNRDLLDDSGDEPGDRFGL